MATDVPALNFLQTCGFLRLSPPRNRSLLQQLQRHLCRNFKRVGLAPPSDRKFHIVRYLYDIRRARAERTEIFLIYAANWMSTNLAE